MPMYEYECPSCGEKDEELKDADKRDEEFICKKCGCSMRRMMSKANFRMHIGLGRYFKGNPLHE